MWDGSVSNVVHDKLGDGADWKYPEGAESRCNWPEWHWKQVCFFFKSEMHKMTYLSRLEEEDKELESLSYDELSKTTTTEAYYPGLPLLAG